MLRCAQSPRVNVLNVRLRSSMYRTPRIWIFLNSLQLNCSKVICFRQVKAIYG
jgi:hypothetical protein